MLENFYQHLTSFELNQVTDSCCKHTTDIIWRSPSTGLPTASILHILFELHCLQTFLLQASYRLYLKSTNQTSLLQEQWMERLILTSGFLNKSYLSILSSNMILFLESLVHITIFSTKESWSSRIRSVQITIILKIMKSAHWRYERLKFWPHGR